MKNIKVNKKNFRKFLALAMSTVIIISMTKASAEVDFTSVKFVPQVVIEQVSQVFYEPKLEGLSDNPGNSEYKLWPTENGCYNLYYDLIYRFEPIYQNDVIAEDFKIYYTIDGTRPSKQSLSVSLENGYYYVIVSDIPYENMVPLQAIAINSKGKKSDLYKVNLVASKDLPAIQETNEYNQKVIAGEISPIFSSIMEETEATHIKIADLAFATIAEIITPEMSDIAKIKAIYNWIQAHTEYDEYFVRLEQNSFMKLLLKGRSTSALTVLEGDKLVSCIGFSKTFDILAKTAGLTSYCINGYNVIDNVPYPHMWNIVKVEGIFYHIDCISPIFALISDETISKHYIWEPGTSYFSLGKESFNPQIECPKDYFDLFPEDIFNFKLTNTVNAQNELSLKLVKR